MEQQALIKRLISEMSAKSPSGFAVAFHIRFTTPDFLFQTYPKDWIDLYSQKGMVMVDPIVRWGFANTGTIRWSELQDLDSEGILKMSAGYGLSFGFACATEEGGSRSVAGFARNDRDFTDDEIAGLQANVIELHRATASTDGMSDELRDILKQMSIQYTHPGTPKS